MFSLCALNGLWYEALILQSEVAHTKDQSCYPIQIPSNNDDDDDDDNDTMDFEHYGGQAGSSSADQPKRRRRRNAARRLLRNKAPISARLTLDPQLRGSIGQVSDDLVKDLFQLRDLTGKWCARG